MEVVLKRYLADHGVDALEMAQASAPRFDAERYGMIYRSSPRQTDILLVNGWISKKIRPHIRRLWEEIPAPKWAVAMGECAISGGPWYDSYNTVQGLDQIVPMHLYIPGCPARPDAMIDGFMLLHSFRLSRLLVGSSRSISGASCRNARARPRRWRSPPESVSPSSPTGVS